MFFIVLRAMQIADCLRSPASHGPCLRQETHRLVLTLAVQQGFSFGNTSWCGTSAADSNFHVVHARTVESQSHSHTDTWSLQIAEFEISTPAISAGCGYADFSEQLIGRQRRLKGVDKKITGTNLTLAGTLLGNHDCIQGHK